VKLVYADTAATTRPHPDVVGAMLPFLGDAFGNASSVHRRGEAAREAIEMARLDVARLMAAQPEEIVFTATGSESNNLALQGRMHLAEGDRRRLIISAIEHSSVLETARALETEPVTETSRAVPSSSAPTVMPMPWTTNEAFISTCTV